jgi:hypothetical protein
MWQLGAALIAALGLAGLYVYGLATSTPAQLALKSAQLANCQRDGALKDARERSFRRMIERRDAAINASQCKAKINYWVRNPDEIPKPFNPHEQLKPGGLN